MTVRTSALRVSLNPYRGCEHAQYLLLCKANARVPWFFYGARLPGTKILGQARCARTASTSSVVTKMEAACFGIYSGVTDAFQPIERRLGLTRRCLAVLAEYRQAVTIITSDRLVTRDLDLLKELAQHNAVGVFVSITSLDEELIGRLEPRTTRPRGRLSAIARLAAAGIPTGVMVAPVIPGLTEHEIPTILKAAAQAGARFAGYTIVRLPLGVAGLFEDWLSQHFPERKEKVLDRIRAMRGGRLNDSRFGVRMSGEGDAAVMIGQIFRSLRAEPGKLARPTLGPSPLLPFAGLCPRTVSSHFSNNPISS